MSKSQNSLERLSEHLNAMVMTTGSEIDNIEVVAKGLAGFAPGYALTNDGLVQCWGNLNFNQVKVIMPDDNVYHIHVDQWFPDSKTVWL